MLSLSVHCEEEELLRSTGMTTAMAAMTNTLEKKKTENTFFITHG